MRTNHKRRPASILASLLAVSLRGSAAVAACADPNAAASLPLPSPEQLEAQGVRIGSIDIDVEEIFDLTQSGESAIPYRFANELHVRTQPDAIRSQLLFGESDPYSRQRVAETERLLHGRRYLYDSWIEPTCYHPDTHTVDLQVRVRDVWSLNPGLTFNRKGGTNRTGFEIEDQDFLGRGELVSVSWGQNVDRTSLLFVYEDPQLLGSWWRGRAAYSDNSDGSFQELAVGRPFYSLDTRWSAGTGLFTGDRVDSRYQRGEVLDTFTEQTDRFEVYAGRSDGLRDGWARRWLAGVRYDRSEFAALPDAALAAALPLDRTLFYPWVGLE